MTEILSLRNIPLMIRAGRILKNYSGCGPVLHHLSSEDLQLLQEVNTIYPEAFDFSNEPPGRVVSLNERSKILMDLLILNASALEAALDCEFNGSMQRYP
ncbi:MAG: hypothetical protein ACRDBO_20390 [Lachnospiraceae bacterium]